MIKKCRIILVIFISIIHLQHVECYAGKKALIIGNSQYQNAPLKNPLNDATDIASTLRNVGFDVTRKMNITHSEMEDAIRTFGNHLNSDDVALFYFSGHGLQVDGINYLLPLGVNIASEDEIKYKAVPADMVLDKLDKAGSRLNIVILDACRDNPFQRVRSLQKGLAVMSAPTGTFIAYATAPGTAAYDGNERNSPYTKSLLQAINTPGLAIERLFKQVRISVISETHNKQVPWESSSLTGDFYFVPPQATSSSGETTTASSETATTVVFTDGFSHGLSSQWRWIRKDAAFWTVRNGMLRLTSPRGGDFWEWVNNGHLLYVDEPSGNYRVESRIIGEPSQDNQQAGMLIYQDDDNYLRFTVGFLLGKFGLEWSHEYKGKFSAEHAALSNVNTKVRIEKQGRTYTAWSYDEQLGDWKKIGTPVTPPFANRKKKVGITAGITSPTPTTFSFDYVTLERLSQ